MGSTMSSWFSTPMSGETLFISQHESLGGLTIAFHRKQNNTGWVMVSAPTTYAFDQYRPPVLFIDDAYSFDLMISKAGSDLDQELDPDSPATYSGDDEMVIGLVWHGIPAQGMGIVGKLLDGSQLSIQTYTKRFEVFRHQVALDDPDLLRQVLRL